MSQETIVLLGPVTNRCPVERTLAEFGWSLEIASTLVGLGAICSRVKVIAVLLDPATLGLPWQRALAAVRREVPGALIILCHRFSDAIEWTDACFAGAFHTLGLPLKLDELHQSLGFVWAARNQRAKKLVALETGDRARRMVKGRARGHVA